MPEWRVPVILSSLSRGLGAIYECVCVSPSWMILSHWPFASRWLFTVYMCAPHLIDAMHSSWAWHNFAFKPHTQATLSPSLSPSSLWAPTPCGPHRKNKQNGEERERKRRRNRKKKSWQQSRLSVKNVFPALALKRKCHQRGTKLSKPERAEWG